MDAYHPEPRMELLPTERPLWDLDQATLTGITDRSVLGLLVAETSEGSLVLDDTQPEPGPGPALHPRPWGASDHQVSGHRSWPECGLSALLPQWGDLPCG